MGSQASRDVVRADRAEKARRALQLRRAGATLERIGLELGVSVPTAHRLVKREISRIPKEEADALRKLIDQRLDEVLHAVWARAMAGELEAIDRVISIEDRRAKLHGLYATASVYIDARVDGRVGAELEAAMRRLEASGLPEDVLRTVFLAIAGDLARDTATGLLPAASPPTEQGSH